METKKRPNSRSTILLLILAGFVLAACGTQVANENWPGMIASGDVVYVAYGPGVLAVDVTEEEALWRYPAKTEASLLFFAAPSVEENRLVFGDYGASGGFFSPSVRVTLYVLDDDNGTPDESWVLGLRDNPDLEANDRIIAPPLQVGNQIFFGTADNYIVAMDAEEERLMWQYSTGHSIWGQPSYDEGMLFVSSLDKTLYAFDAENGEIIWQTPLGGALASKPVVGDGLVYVSSFDKDMHALDKKTGVEQWSAPAADWVWAAPALGEDMVFYADISGNLYAVSAETGEPQWQEEGLGVIQAAPVYADGVVYIASAGDLSLDEEEQRGEIIALNAADGSLLWREETPAPLFTTPVLVNDALVVAMKSDQALLSVYDLQNGDKRWDFMPAAE